ncbi:universal stress protein [Solirubrobacter phytolaccae]|uniref:Universal stress protein n=1 Tax=Solirubrobacter phytolaccae TaxID=1404360 RepID=A0A9X3SA70_9ACTN|nr:universal stress protein [Solirubrobacter phytolaccae]MDA0184174.1 universal stress protein [Solirubrobacter phytolaccae]
MLRYRHILIAFDGSPEGELALAHAVAMAHSFRARLTIVAVRPRPKWPARPGQEDLEERLRAAADGVPDDLGVTTQLLDGDVADEVLRAARDGEHDLIVIGGAAAGRVAQDTEIPVIAVHRPNEGPDLAA